ncbi:uncharacterized protein LOC117922966 isoform X3 [Vitis riparia]|uniref:uncharacterized protein LOC117922966 isoform X3 n=1 Tax=Vitis riparia TaxID=96939 RepID=UPI00155B3580|nr:uncharacterized protein LOC117922966 isoform X3 [Vitis riparia]
MQLIQMMKHLQPRARVHLPMEDEEEMQDTNSQDKSNEKVNMQNNEGEGKASGDTEPEKVAGMEKEGTEKSGEEETDNKTAEINEWANIGKERKETPPLLTRWLLTRNYCRNLCIVHSWRATQEGTIA